MLLGGAIAYAQGAYSSPCTIRNLSDNGALITLPAQLSLPPNVYLINLRGRTAYESLVEWQRGAQAGLRFLSSVNLDAVTDPNLGYLRQLWNALRSA